MVYTVNAILFIDMHTRIIFIGAYFKIRVYEPNEARNLLGTTQVLYQKNNSMHIS